MLKMSAILARDILAGGDALGSSWLVKMFDPSVIRLRSSDIKLSFLIGWDEFVGVTAGIVCTRVTSH
jgi:hypothetical protein